MPKGSLRPENMTGGGAVADGEYTLAKLVVAGFNYGGNGPETPACLITYKDAAGTETEQAYTAGAQAEMGRDGKSFVSMAKSSNFAMWIVSIAKAGFPEDKIESDVTVFQGAKVHVSAVAQPKRAGLKDQAEGKTIVLVDKLISMPGTKAAAKAPVEAGASVGDDALITAVQEQLAKVEGGQDRGKLVTAVYLNAIRQKVNSADATAMKKTLTLEWLNENAEAGGWTVNGEVVSL
jgi:hypothetical protein